MVGDDADAARAIHADPGAASLQVPAGEDLAQGARCAPLCAGGSRRPPRERRRGPIVELVAVGRDDPVGTAGATAGRERAGKRSARGGAGECVDLCVHAQPAGKNLSSHVMKLRKSRSARHASSRGPYGAAASVATPGVGFRYARRRRRIRLSPARAAPSSAKDWGSGTEPAERSPGTMLNKT